MKQDLTPILNKSTFLLLKVFLRMQEIGIELMRTSEISAVLLELGMQKDDDIQIILNNIKESVNKKGISEMINSLQLLSYFPEEKKQSELLINIILANRNIDGGIGRFISDRSRIPVCWRLLECLCLHKWLYDSNINELITWMQKEWIKDSQIQKGGLSYKCSGILIANSYYPKFDKEFISDTLDWLINDQNEDGGWGPRKDSPSGSIPSDTALALRALSNYKAKKIEVAIEKGLKWLLKNRLNNGFWKEHPAEKPLIDISIFLNKYLKNETKFH